MLLYVLFLNVLFVYKVLIYSNSCDLSSNPKTGPLFSGRAGGNDAHRVSPTVSLLNRWQFTNTATVENLLKSLHSIERADCASLLEAKYNVIVIECLTAHTARVVDVEIGDSAGLGEINLAKDGFLLVA